MINTNVKKQYPVIRMPNGHPVSSTMYNRGDLHGVIYNNDVEFDDVLLSNITATSTVFVNLNVSTNISSNTSSLSSSLANVTVSKLINSTVTTTSNVTADVNLAYNLSASLLATGTTTADLTVQSAASLLLDLYPNASAAYSLRKLRTAYTGSAVRVRRSSDNTEQDIGFVAGQLDTVSLLAFCGTGNGFVQTWYDQSGSARDARQTTQANQPQIVSSGVVNQINNKPSLNFDGVNDSMTFNDINFTNTGNLISFVGKRAASGNWLYSLAGVQYIMALGSDSFYYLQSRTNGYQLSTNTDTTTNQLLLSGVNNGTNQLIYKNNLVIPSNFVSFTLSTGINTIGFYTGLPNTRANLQEIIYYNFENSSNLNGINTNINTHYAIY